MVPIENSYIWHSAPPGQKPLPTIPFQYHNLLEMTGVFEILAIAG